MDIEQEKNELLVSLKTALWALRRLQGLRAYPVIATDILDHERLTGEKFHGFGLMELTLFLLTGEKSVLMETPEGSQ